LGEWTITRDGNDVRIGADPEALLHALVMAEGEIDAEKLVSVLPDRDNLETDRKKAMKGALSTLRNDKRYRLSISREKDPVTMSHDQPHASIDLWEFFEFAQLKRYKEAAKLISAGSRGPVQLEKFADHNKLWKPMSKKFDLVKREVMAAVKGEIGSNRMMRDTRKLLLERSLVPGVGGEVQIGEVRGEIEPIGIPWYSLKPDTGLVLEPLPPYLSGLLEDEATPQRVIVIGDHGRGKTLAAIASYLEMTDHLEKADATHESRPIIYVDGEIEGLDTGFATDEWLDEYLDKFDAIGHGQRIAIVPHADAFFLREKRPLKEILGWRMFREGDVLLCCSEQFYLTSLRFEGYATHVVRLEPWEPETQLAYISARFGKKTCAAFAAWRDADPTEMRAELCEVPLHLIYVVPIVGENDEALERISVRWHLFDQLSRLRLDTAGHALKEDDRFNELAAIAHRFYRSDSPSGSSIGFNPEELRDFLKGFDDRDPEARADALLNNTLLVAPPSGSDEHCFEMAAWGWFFAASHLARVLKLSDPPEPALKAFGKYFLPEVMDFCEEMLLEALPLHEETILGALRHALLEDEETELRPMQRAFSRSQVGYLLALLGDEAIREELSRMIDPQAATAESDPLVRDEIERGLKGSKLRLAADAFGHRGGV
jgi:hypothetical protein